MTQNNHYEHKLVNVGEEVDNLIESLREQNRGLQIILDSKKNVPEDFEKEKKVYQFRIDMLEKQNKKLGMIWRMLLNIHLMKERE